MFLKRLEVVGFKSFATRTVAEMPTGIVVVVGPNGSGKSNVADAVRWVLGEQSSKAVRARKPEEVIFAGSATRQPLGMAEVSLVLDNADNTIPLAYSEVRVTRRLYRSGDSEYLLNNSRVRLKDVVAALLHARLGPDTYSVIGQGSVDELILQRPEERRVAFENVADIRRHQIQLNDMRNKLAATQSNLTRVQDVLLELAPHVRRLKSQADRAARAEAYRTELQDLSLRYYGAVLWRLRSARAEADRLLAEAAARAGQAEMASAEAQAAWSAAESAGGALDERLADLRPRVQAQREARFAAERALAVARERYAAQQSQQASLRAESDRMAEHITTLRGEIDARAPRLLVVENPPEGVAARIAVLREQVTEVARTEQAWRKQLHDARGQRDAAEQRIRRAEGDASRAQERLRTLQTSAVVEEARQSDARTRIDRLTEEITRLETEASATSARLLAARQQVAEADELRASATQRVSQLRESLRQSAQQADRIQGALEALGLGDAPASDSSALAETWQRALDGLPVVGLAGELAARVRPIDLLMRAYLMRVAVLPDDATAREAHQRLARALGADELGWAVLSLDGLLIAAPGERALEAVSGEGSALADWKRRVQELEAERAVALGARRQAETDLQTATDVQARADAEAGSLRAAVRDAEAAAQTLARGLANARAEHASLRSVLQKSVDQRARTQAEVQTLTARAEQAQAELQRERVERDQANAVLAEAESHLASIREEAEEVRSGLQLLETEEARRLAERQTQQALLARLKTELDTAEAALKTTRARLEQTVGALQGLAEEEARYRAEVRQASDALAPLEADLAAAERERAEHQARRREAEQRLQTLREAERAAHTRREEVHVRAQRAVDELERLEREVQDLADTEDAEEGPDEGWQGSLRAMLAEVRAQSEPLDEDASRKRLATLQRELRAVGTAGGSGVLVEYREMSERHAFLEHQAEDLRAAMAELRAAAGELEEHMRGRFSEVFERVNAAFQECFVTLFGGGEARLVLTQPDDLLGTGVDIVARPPGKKLQGLLSLSGGERALTIVALLFGLLKVNPTPFCVLDEVDAALDEANVQRFADLLGQFAREIQFIVVTHNRATMEIADALYGVSMDTHGISKVLAIRPREMAQA